MYTSIGNTSVHCKIQMRLQIAFYPNVVPHRRLLETLDSAYAESNLFFIGFHFPMLFDQNSFIGQFSQPSFRCQVQQLDICCIRAEAIHKRRLYKSRASQFGTRSYAILLQRSLFKNYLPSFFKGQFLWDKASPLLNLHYYQSLMKYPRDMKKITW